MNEAEEIAKAIQESAKFGEKGLEVAEKAGEFFAKIFKEPVAEISGMITDKLRFLRWKRMVEMADEVNGILEKKGIHQTRAVPPKLALPILEEASLEEDNTLKFLWNNLLANAMNPQFNDEIRYGFVEMIKETTGIEATILREFYEILEKEGKLEPLDKIYDYRLNKEQIMDILKINAETYALSANNLMRMQLIAPAVIKAEGIKFGHEPTTIYKGIDAVTMTPLGVRFVEACIKE